MATHESVIAARRFGIGARPGELARTDRGALLAGLEDPARYLVDPAGLPTAVDALARVDEVRRLAEGETVSADPVTEAKVGLAETLTPELAARFQRAVTTTDGFAERLVWFWSNHFTAAATKALSAPFVGLFEREVIRGNLAGSFSAMLLASTRHPAMSTYLDQVRSMGPSSTLGRARGAGLNENLAREVLELHTLGVHGGYTQDDVGELARALTGWTVALPRFARFVGDAAPGSPVFVAAMHEPGARRVLGRDYPDAGEEQAPAILRDLARHPATARRVAARLVRHFVADEPPEDAVDTVARVFRDTDGDLPSVHRAVIGLTAAWEPEPRKRTSPIEFVVGGLRALGATDFDARAVNGWLTLLGQPTWRAPSPAGFPDTTAGWGGSDALSKRIDAARQALRRFPAPARPDEWLKDVLGPTAQERTLAAVRRAATPEQGALLALMSPEFQWR